MATEPGINTGSGTAVSTDAGDLFSSAMAALDRQMEDLIGDRGLTPLVGALAVLLAVLLGCGHALLPGHGKTVMAAYLAGRRGSPRDAVTVGATVTATHTVGVLVLGLAISLSSTLAGDQVLRWLGVVSGLLVTGIGALMLRGAVPRWRAARARRVVTVEGLPEPALAVGVSALAGHGAVHRHSDHDHGHAHDHGHDEHGGSLISRGIAGGLVPAPPHSSCSSRQSGWGGPSSASCSSSPMESAWRELSPPSGLALVKLRGRLEHRVAGLRRAHLVAGVARAVPVLTAALVLLVGLALVTRGVVLGA